MYPTPANHYLYMNLATLVKKSKQNLEFDNFAGAKMTAVLRLDFRLHI